MRFKWLSSNAWFKKIRLNLSSLKWRLVLSISTAFVVVWAVAFVWLYVNIERKMTETLDNRLFASAHMVSRLLLQVPAQQLAHTDLSFKKDHHPHYLIACEVSLINADQGNELNPKVSQIIARTNGAPQNLDKRAAGFSTWTENGEEWRSYTLKKSPIQVVVAEKMQLRSQLLSDILQSILWPLILTLILCVALILWVIKHQFKPVEYTAELIKQHRSSLELDYLRQLQLSAAPRELQSFIESISELILRLQRSLENEKNFSAFAAHELRSPLTAIKLNVQLAQMLLTSSESSVVDIEKATAILHDAEQNIQRYQQLLEQLLLLSKTEHQLDMPNATANLKKVMQSLWAQLQLNHPDLDQLIQVHWDSLGVFKIQATALSMVLVNIIENSLKHAHSQQAIQIYQRDQQLCIEDFGVGMSAEELDLAKQRFWRKSAMSQGHGLGLALAESVLEQQGYQLILLSKADHGLLVIIQTKQQT